MLVNRNLNGFTLVELIAGIVVFAIALTLVTTLVASQSRQSIDPIWQVRATELAQSLLNEISGKAFDENSDFVGGVVRCNESTPCSLSSALGPDGGESRDDFDDVDDFNGLDVSGGGITNSLNQSLLGPQGNLYEGFRVRVTVFYDDNFDGINDDDIDQDGNLDTGNYVGNRKLIQVRVTTPGGDSIPFALLKANY